MALKISGAETSPHSSPSLFLRHFSKVLVLCVALLVFAGAMVTSHGAGLSVPDWPNSYGHNMFLFPPSMWVGGIFYEHVHRLIASGIGLLSVVLAIAMWRLEPRRWVRLLSYAGVGAVILQGVLGGLTVLFLLPPAISTAHALLAQAFFIITIVLAYAESAELAARRAGGEGSEPGLLRCALFAAGAIYLQLFFGAVMRHTGAGLAVPDFPSAAGRALPSWSSAAVAAVNALREQFSLLYPTGAAQAELLGTVSAAQVAIHLLHRYWALVVVAAVLRLGWRSLGGENAAAFVLARRTARLALAVVVLQFALGVLTIQSLRNPLVTSVHVLFGALLLGITVLTALRAWMPSDPA